MKKGLLFIGALAIVFATVPMFAAYEAHVINVTAHIENALSVHPENGELTFGTVFPQEYQQRSLSISLSDSFQAQEEAYGLQYVIKQKPKCWNWDGVGTKPTGILFAPVNYWDDQCPVIDNVQYYPMPSLCAYLSKTPTGTDQAPYTD